MVYREPAFTLGLEEEYLLVDRATRDLVREPPPELLQISRASEEDQLKRLAAVKADRGADRVDAALARLRRDAAEPTVNLMPGILDAVDAYATVGEIMGALADVFGRHREVPVI